MNHLSRNLARDLDEALRRLIEAREYVDRDQRDPAMGRINRAIVIVEMVLKHPEKYR